MTIKTTPWTEEEKTRGIEGYDNGVALVKSEDMFDNSAFSSFADFREKYKEHYGVDTTMTDDQIVVLLVSSDDDEEPEWFIERAKDAETYLTGESNHIFDQLARAKAA